MGNGENKEIGFFDIKSYTQDVLCTYHNTALSSIDGVMATFFRDMEYLIFGRSQNPPTLSPPDGRMVEKWMLKTFCGGMYSGDLPIPNGVSAKGVLPPKEFIDILFNGAEFTPPLGSYIHYGGDGVEFLSDHSMYRHVVIMGNREDGKHPPGGAVIGLRCYFCGIEFRLFTVPMNEEWLKTSNMTYRPTKLIVVNEGREIDIEQEKPATHPILLMMRSEPNPHYVPPEER
ncbi:hypothetical protein BH11PLA2_BH11PLA2_34010 [soil metagenome]